MLSGIDQNSSKSTDNVKIHFNITKKVDYGKAVYVVGNIEALGVWSVTSSFRLSWN